MNTQSMHSKNYTDDNAFNYGIKDLPKSFFYSFLIYAAIFSLVSWDVINGIMAGAVTALLLTPCLYFMEISGRKRHKKIVYSNLFENIKREGFKEEKLGHFRGLIGERKGYACRIYYEWNGEAKGFLSFGDIVLLVYYQLLLTEEKTPDGYPIVDNEIMEKLNRQVEYSMFSANRITSYTPAFVKRNINYFLWTKPEKIIDELNGLISAVEKNNLIPQSLIEVRKNEMKYVDFYFPLNDFLIDYFNNK